MICDKMDKKVCPLVPNSVELLSFSGTVETNTLTLRSPFAIFEPYPSQSCREVLQAPSKNAG